MNEIYDCSGRLDRFGGVIQPPEDDFGPDPKPEEEEEPEDDE